MNPSGSLVLLPPKQRSRKLVVGSHSLHDSEESATFFKTKDNAGQKRQPKTKEKSRKRPKSPKILSDPHKMQIDTLVFLQKSKNPAEKLSHQHTII
mmetsp:Transcript_7694/g.11405  ORF Transcript_7694/g.11405 Transcript_7694/m.11405 type:complete len:96 (-) Transcript_7694:110-397(-)